MWGSIFKSRGNANTGLYYHLEEEKEKLLLIIN